MAGFRTHITVSTLCGLGYGAAAVRPLGFPAETAFLAAGVTAVGGMLPDLDSDSGVPVRELSGLAAAVVPLLLMPRLGTGMTQEGVLATLVFLYLLIRYGLGFVLRRVSVHRGMFHSIPAMLIFGLLVYLEYHGAMRVRLLLAGGVMLGFLSHLVLDEIYAVDFNGVRLRLNQFAGSALKFASPSWVATCVCYGLLTGLGFLAYLDYLETAAR
ncbi:MAG TPA: metal-dependent hydrolase [Fimbriiglobus sp.]|nr:metal-dependent hydrolase [Fimbriiglobus sp.]